MTATTHPLFGRLLVASGFKRRDGVLLLVVTLPDGSPGTIRADATNIVGEAPAEFGSTVLSVEGLRRLHELIVALRPIRQRRGRLTARK